MILKLYFLLSTIFFLIKSREYKYELLHRAPYGTRLLVSGRDPAEMISFNKPLNCSLNTKPAEYFPIRIITVSRADQRAGPFFYRILTCFNVLKQLWESDTNCDFHNIIINNSTTEAVKITIYVMECQIKSEIYAAELRFEGQSVSAVINQLMLPRCNVKIPGETIACVNRDEPHIKNTWQLEWNGHFHPHEPSPIVTNFTFEPCPQVFFGVAYYYHCYRNQTLLHDIYYFILYCFDFGFASYLGENRIEDSYDAGEMISCTLDPAELVHNKNFTWFNPSFPFKVVLGSSGKWVTNNSYWMIIPENLKGCKNCTVTCVYDMFGNIQYFPSSSKLVNISTNYLTYLTMQNGINLVYNETFKCLSPKYPSNVVTVALKEENPQPPHSVAALNSKSIRYKSKPDGWLILMPEYERSGGNNVWMIYCQFNNSEITTPIFEEFYQYERITFTQIYPPNTNYTYGLDGFIYKCEGFNFFLTKITCFDACDFVKIKAGPHLRISYVEITPFFEVKRLRLKCLGYRSLSDAAPMTLEKSLHIYPSRGNKALLEVHIGNNFSCHKTYVYNGVLLSYLPDVEVSFEQDGNKWTVRSDIAGGKPYVEIPDRNYWNLVVEYCCVSSVNTEGDFICKSQSLIKIKIIAEIKATFDPELTENANTYLDMGTIISCSLCIIYTISYKLPTCFYKNRLVMHITKPFQPDVTINGTGFVRLPSSNVMDSKVDFDQWNTSVKCYNKINDKVLERWVKLNTCTKNLTIIPERKTLFRINESLECAMKSLVCRESTVFSILIFTESLITTNIKKGLSVKLDWKHVGNNVVKCSLYNNDKIFIERKIIVVTPPTNLQILNYKNVLLIGESILCEASGSPTPTKDWWFVEGPGNLQVSNNILTVLPSTLSGFYVYECIIQNLHGRLRQLVKFRVYNRLLRSTGGNNYGLEVIISFSIIVLCFFILLFFLRSIYSDGPVHHDHTLF